MVYILIKSITERESSEERREHVNGLVECITQVKLAKGAREMIHFLIEIVPQVDTVVWAMSRATRLCKSWRRTMVRSVTSQMACRSTTVRSEKFGVDGISWRRHRWESESTMGYVLKKSGRPAYTWTRVAHNRGSMASRKNFLFVSS